MTRYYTVHFADTYGSGAYGEGVYSCVDVTNAACQTSTGTSSSSSSLADTGTLVMLFVSIACLIIFVALIVRIWRRKPATQPAQATTEEQPESDPRDSTLRMQ